MSHDGIPHGMQDVRLVPELQPLLVTFDEPAMVVVAGMARILDTFGLLNHPRRRFDISGLGDSPKLRAYPYWVADVFQKVRADRKIKRLIRDGPGMAVAQIRLNPSIFRIPCLDSEFLVDVSVAARAEFLIRHRINYVICPRKGSSPTSDINDLRIIRNSL